MYWVWVPPLPDVVRVAVHADCKHSEWASLVHRHLRPVNPPTTTAVKGLRRLARALVTRIRRRTIVDFNPWKYEEVVAGYTGAKKKRYQRALESLRDDGGVTTEDARVEAFVKAEKRNLSNLKQPRCIQFRTYRYALSLMVYLKPVCAAMDHIKSNTNTMGRRTRVFPVGMNQHQLAELLIRKAEAIDDCVVIPLDVSGFDYRVSRQQLLVEHSVYNSLYRGDPELQRLLAMQLCNQGRTKHGIKYWCDGRRMSGDANTSLGNRTLMYLMLTLAMELVPCAYELIVDGDDAIIFVGSKYEAAARSALMTTFTNCGHVLVAEDSCTIMDAVYHRSKIVWGAKGWTMVRDPWLVMGTAFAGHTHYHEKRGGLKAMKTIAQGLLVLHLGVPVLQSFAIGVLRSLRGVSWLLSSLDDFTRTRLEREHHDWLMVRPETVTDKARSTFARAWGIDPEGQRRLERYLEKDRSAQLDDYSFQLLSEQWLPSNTGGEGVGDWCDRL